MSHTIQKLFNSRWLSFDQKIELAERVVANHNMKRQNPTGVLQLQEFKVTRIDVLVSQLERALDADLPDHFQEKICFGVSDAELDTWITEHIPA